MRPVILFTDFGFDGPYVGQLRLAVHRLAPQVPVFDLMHDAPAFSPHAAGWLLEAFTERLPEDAVVCAVIDPGVGTTRHPVIVEAGNRLFVGPDNGLLNAIAAAHHPSRWWHLAWQPDGMSASFHGRDLFAPSAARLALGDWPPHHECAAPEDGMPQDRARVIYADAFGNAWTGLRDMVPNATLMAGGLSFAPARTFGDRPPGHALWYTNSNGFIELAVNQGSAMQAAGLNLGDPVQVRMP